MTQLFRSPSPSEIRAFREKHQLKKMDCANFLGVSFGSWESWEAGKSDMRFSLWEWLHIIVSLPKEERSVYDLQSRGKVLHRVRLEQGKSLTEMAKIMGVYRATYIQWEQGTRMIPAEDWSLFFSSLGIPEEPLPEILAHPSPEEVRQARFSCKRNGAEMTAQEAAFSIGVTSATWLNWERGIRKMPIAYWQYFQYLCKTGTLMGDWMREHALLCEE